MAKETKIDKQIKKSFPFLVVLAALVLVFIVSYFLFKGWGKIEYQGLTFTKENIGGILVYSYEYLIKSDEKIIKNTLFLRHNPRENNVSVEGDIIYPEGRRVMVSINNTGLLECEDSVIAMPTLVNFFAANRLDLRVGTPDEGIAKEKNQTYITCKNYPNNPVIAIRAADKASIKRTGNYCYNIDVGNCEIQQAIEKFIVQSIIDAKESK